MNISWKLKKNSVVVININGNYITIQNTLDDLRLFREVIEDIYFNEKKYYKEDNR